MASSCHVCGASNLSPLDGFERLPRVTSDCRPFPSGGKLAVCGGCGAVVKPADATFLADIAAVYAEYDAYYQGGGSEQAVFDVASGATVRRSALLTARLDAALGGTLPASGRAIDIGCGKGGFLRMLGERRPGWELYGLELDDRNLEPLRTIPRFQELMTGDVDTFTGSFDLISMVHALEHLTAPRRTLGKLRGNISPGGVLFIQVPDLSANPFDLVIADHATHFTVASLDFLLRSAGWQPLVIDSTWIPKEISVLAIPTQRSSGPIPSQSRVATAHLIWLNAVMQVARSHAASCRPFGLFGTSIAATWLAGGLGDQLDFFVDEDQSRIGRTFLRKPVLAPQAAPAGATLFLGLAPVVAASLASRLAHLDLRLIQPPSIDAQQEGQQGAQQMV